MRWYPGKYIVQCSVYDRDCQFTFQFLLKLIVLLHLKFQPITICSVLGAHTTDPVLHWILTRVYVRVYINLYIKCAFYVNQVSATENLYNYTI